MKKLTFLVILILFFSILVSCAQPTETPTTSGEMINLGDEINGMVFTTTEEHDMYISFNAYCGWDPKEKTETTFYYECAATLGDRITFGNCIGIMGDNTKDLDESWEILKKDEITFDGKKVNLSSFGTQDFIAHNGKPARIWNVTVENIAPGDHTIQCKFEYEGVSYEENIAISVPSEMGVYPVLSPDVGPGLHRFTSEQAKLNYFLMLPGEYGTNPQEKWPLILSLHGFDQGVMNDMDLLEGWLLKPTDDIADFPFIVLSPQGKGEYEFWATDEMISALITLLDEIKASVAIDAKRIYLIGHSAGGNGTWSLGLAHPERFAALAPAAGYYGWPYTVPENICDLKEVPIWAFHGAKDEIIPLEAEQMLIDALEACGGNVQFTIFPDTGHDVDSRQVYTSELFTWLLEQERR